MVYVNESHLELMLKKAAREHEKHAASLGGADPNWQAWYAHWIVKRLREHEEKE